MLTVAGGLLDSIWVNAVWPQQQDRNWQEEANEDPWAEGPSEEETAIWEVGTA